MILTCPACDTKYVVKDDAIPPGGRQVRCASCKLSWHQQPEGEAPEAEPVAEDMGGPPTPGGDMGEQPLADTPAEAAEEGEVAGEPQPETGEEWDTGWESAADQLSDDPAREGEAAAEGGPAAADEWREAEAAAQEPQFSEERFASYAPIVDEDEAPRRRWPLILAVVALIGAAAAAFWYFAPPEWKERAGLSAAGSSQLQLRITMRERQPLESGNELVLVGGRITNPTSREQRVPPIQAKLRDPQSNAIVHQWTINPPKNVLAPGESTSFNSAELDKPRDGDQLLDVRLGG